MRALGSERSRCRPAEAPQLVGAAPARGHTAADPQARLLRRGGAAPPGACADAAARPPYIGGKRTTRYIAETATVTSMTGKPYFMKPPKVIS